MPSNSRGDPAAASLSAYPFPPPLDHPVQMESSRKANPPLTVWIITMHNNVTREEFERCSQSVDKSCIPKRSYLKGETAWRYIISCLLPQMVMRKQHLPRRCWSFQKTKSVESSGKAYIAMKPESLKSESQFLGFSSAETGSAMAFAFTQGKKHQAVNIGVGIMSCHLKVSTESFFASQLHKLTEREERSVSLKTHPEDVALRRLLIILSIKDAYVRALGQPIGFDHSRIEVRIPRKTITVDGEQLLGWEFRLFKANLGVSKHVSPEDSQYQCATACFRGWNRTTFTFSQTQEELDEYVQFYDLQQIVEAVPRLGEYDNSALPPLSKLSLSTKTSMASMTSIGDVKHPAPPSYNYSHSLLPPHYAPNSLDYSDRFKKGPLPPMIAT
ncbi:hypothetical protein SISSUDRAFT_1060819 [Sistotremastrum suecicum HHB10207 ss-3]|uniref:holo-[acyl-carrier-protein] synthase n=1 Tax=Sistotremastrum suecicum HHB10207 ss-3 TaxID=1314776 RepID=A0A166EMS0_9AGAM|nr:hypothetical protein SISSUDRAFT_1060819 [Sistotremastrum suecicum HHB10207 ss-3]